ncbi:MAG: MlaD family protein [Betaproteobacteria bacterium]
MVALVAGAGVYVMYARGAFEVTQRLVLVTDDSEGVVVGSDLTFAGFPIGRVGRIELSPEGNARLLVDVASKDAHWLRTTSIFTLERSIVGGTRLRAFSGVLTDPPLPDGASRTLLVGDATAELPRLITTAKELIANLKTLTAADSSLDMSLANINSLTEKFKGRSGALGALLGDEKNAEKLLLALDRANSLLAKVDTLAANADRQVFGPQGVMKDAHATVIELNALLADARASLKKVDAVLIEAQAVGANAKAGTADLGALRAEIDSSLRKVDHLVNEINRKWPFARDTELRLP